MRYARKQYAPSPDREFYIHRNKSRRAKRRAKTIARRKEIKDLTILSIQLLLGLSKNAQILPKHLDQADKKLGLPIVRLYLDRPSHYASFTGRMRRIYEALQKRA